MCGILGYYGVNTPKEKIRNEFAKIKYRGPDSTNYFIHNNAVLGFHRLAIRNLNTIGDQPFIDHENQRVLVCNGEVYNDSQLQNKFSLDENLKDCQLLLPLIEKIGFFDTNCELDAEFAIIYYDINQNEIYASRDPLGIRPLFYGYNEFQEIFFASEAKALQELCKTITPFPPGHMYSKKTGFIEYRSLINQKQNIYKQTTTIIEDIAEKFTAAVEKRLVSDVPMGFLLSGGLDSSLVCAIAAKKLQKPIQTFVVGCNLDAIDITYANQVAEYIQSNHTVVHFTLKQALESLRQVIYHLESWDVTTIRASVGMFLVCEYISKNTNIKVLLTGEVSDELFGYKYTDFAPTPLDFQEEARKRIHELYLYDVLRADRCISAHGLEARVPFGDLDFVDYVMGIDPELKMNDTGVGKNLLRKAFERQRILPRGILMREKAAFSDAVGHSVVDYLKNHANSMISDKEFEDAQKEQLFIKPISKEALFYLKIFNEFFPGRQNLIKDYWMPNKSWENCQTNDPSARYLPNYGQSGV